MPRVFLIGVFDLAVKEKLDGMTPNVGTTTLAGQHIAWFREARFTSRICWDH